jgi:hypothetical protein
MHRAANFPSFLDDMAFRMVKQLHKIILARTFISQRVKAFLRDTRPEHSVRREACCTTIWNDVQVYEIFFLTPFVIVVTELALFFSLRG